MTNRKKLLLALAVVEWAGVVQHLAAMSQAGIDVPPDVERLTGQELGVLTTNWATVTGDTSVDASIASARAWVTENMAYAEAVLGAAGVGARG